MNTPINEPNNILEILDLDHPGANDEVYRERREHIAHLARSFRTDPVNIPSVDYTTQEKNTWKEVVDILDDLQDKHACSMYLRARKKLNITSNEIPQMKQLSRAVSRFNGMTLAPIEGLVDSRTFLTNLADLRMFCTQYVRHHSRPTFTPEPDVIHEFIGHVPTFADPDLVAFTRYIGEAAKKANNEQIKKLERLYWFTLEYGLIEEKDELKLFGAGPLAGIEDLQKSMKSGADVRPFDIDVVSETDYNYSFIQPFYFAIPSFSFLKKEMEKFIVREGLV